MFMRTFYLKEEHMSEAIIRSQKIAMKMPKSEFPFKQIALPRHHSQISYSWYELSRDFRVDLTDDAWRSEALQQAIFWRINIEGVDMAVS